MERRRLVQRALLLVLATVPVSIQGLQSTSYGGWPSLGFAVALLVVVGREHHWRWMAVLYVTQSLALAYSYQISVLFGMVGGLVVVLPAHVSWRILTRRGQDTLFLDRVDKWRYHRATIVSALLCGVLALVTVAGVFSPAEALLSAGLAVIAALTAQMVVLPLLLRGGTVRPAGPTELWVQRTVLVVVVLAVFLPRTSLSLVFLVFPVLAWAAMRATAREAHLQLLLVCGTAYALTFVGLGPIADLPSALPEQLSPALLYAFAGAACYLVVPLTLMVEQLVGMTRSATRSATAIERLFDAAGHTVLIATDEIGRITHYNAGAHRTLGYSEEEVLGRRPAMFHSAAEIERQAAHFGTAPDHAAVSLAMAATGERRDWAFTHRDGSERMISLSLSEVVDPRGRVVGYIGGGEDITERKRAQDALAAALAREHASVVRLQEVDDVKQDLVSNVSHELRTPITSISGYAELLADRELGDLNRAQADAVERIERNTTRLGLLVEDLLTLSRAESGQLVLESVEVDLRTVAEEGLDLVEELVRNGQVDVRCEVPDEPATVLGDRHALERVAVNLLTNAIKFTPDGGSAVIAVRPDPGGVALVVSDTGLGIDEAEQEQLFTRFFRSTTASEHAIQGTGLGLSIVHAIVSQHGGTVSVESAPGRGTTVTAVLPRGGAEGSAD